MREFRKPVSTVFTFPIQLGDSNGAEITHFTFNSYHAASFFFFIAHMHNVIYTSRTCSRFSQSIVTLTLKSERNNGNHKADRSIVPGTCRIKRFIILTSLSLVLPTGQTTQSKGSGRSLHGGMVNATLKEIYRHRKPLTHHPNMT